MYIILPVLRALHIKIAAFGCYFIDRHVAKKICPED